MFLKPGLQSCRSMLLRNNNSSSFLVSKNNVFDFNLIQKAFVSTSGKDARSKYAYFFNKPKQNRKSKEHYEEMGKRIAVSVEKKKFKFDSAKPLKDHLKYSEKFHCSRGMRSKRSALKTRITRFGKTATPTPFMNSTEKDHEGNPIDPTLKGYANIDEYLANIDTSLTDEQRVYVDMLKKKLKGGSGVRSVYRDVPRPEEIKGTGNFLPKIAENAEELIDWALSHVPKRKLLYPQHAQRSI